MGALEQLVIVGAGFAGLACARAMRGGSYQVTVLDRRNHHLFQPLLYQVATGLLEPAAVLWVAGITPAPWIQALALPHDPSGRIQVGADFSVVWQPDIYVIGDLAATPTLLPQVAPAAMQSGHALARRRHCRQPRVPRTVASGLSSPTRSKISGAGSRFLTAPLQ